MFLAYTNCDTLPPDERYIFATDIALAAITGDDVYNFGEVLTTPILNALQNTPNEWLFDLVVALNNGDIEKFNLCIEKNQIPYYNQLSLKLRHEFIKQKVVLLCLMNLIFERHSHDRMIHFNEIALKTKIPLDQVSTM